MAEHTPGPWVWWTSNSWRRLKRDDRGITQSVMEPYVCSDGHPDCSINEADMRLIAAAPDLLEALRELHDDIQGRIDDGGRFNPGTLTALKAAREALDKASHASREDA